MRCACPEEFIKLARSMVEAAREITLPNFRTNLGHELKADRTPVTIADRKTEARLRELIEAAFPDHGIIGEEYGVERKDASHVWVLDPIDGTKKFMTGNPLFGTLISLLRDGKPILGVIDAPAVDDTWIGATGHGTKHITGAGERQVRCRTCSNLAGAVLYTTAPEMFEGAEEAAFNRLKSQVLFPLYGGECYAYGLLANGTADLVVEGDMAIHDYLSHVPIVTEAGGMMTDWEGNPLGLDSGRNVIAAGDPVCHAAALDLLNQAG